MAKRDMRLTTAVWDDVADTVMLTFQEKVTVPGPGSENGNWYEEGAATITFTVPIRRAVVTSATGRQLTIVDGEVVYTRFELVNGVWVDRGRINADGTPYTG